MADDAVRSLVCLVEGDSSLFLVKPTRNVPILELKDLIVKNCKIDVDVRAIRIWKVSMSMASDSTTHSPAG